MTHPSQLTPNRYENSTITNTIPRHLRQNSLHATTPENNLKTTHTRKIYSSIDSDAPNQFLCGCHLRHGAAHGRNRLHFWSSRLRPSPNPWFYTTTIHFHDPFLYSKIFQSSNSSPRYIIPCTSSTLRIISVVQINELSSLFYIKITSIRLYIHNTYLISNLLSPHIYATLYFDSHYLAQ